MEAQRGDVTHQRSHSQQTANPDRLPSKGVQRPRKGQSGCACRAGRRTQPDNSMAAGSAKMSDGNGRNSGKGDRKPQEEPTLPGRIFMTPLRWTHPKEKADKSGYSQGPNSPSFKKALEHQG